MSTSTEKYLHYRRAEFVKPDNGLTLQASLNQALTQNSVIGRRRESLYQTSQQIGGWSRFINTHLAAHGMEFGVLVLIEPGQNKLLIENIDNKDQLNVSQIPAPEGTEFMESYLCYGVKDDHVILLQSIGLQAKQLEAHLLWLLGASCSAILSDEDGVFLNNYAPQDTYEMVEASAVDSVSLHVPLGSTESTESVSNSSGASTTTTVERANVESTNFSAGKKGLDVLRALFPTDRIASILNNNTRSSEEEVEVFVEVKRKRYAKSLETSSQDLLNSVARTMRYMDSDEVKITLDNGSTLTGDKLTVKSKQRFASVDGILDMSDVFLKMSNWLRELIESEQISN